MSLVRICANKRYAAIDKLVSEIKLENGQGSRTVLEDRSPEDFSAELLCKFWNILKANPRFDLEGAIEDRLKACPLNDAVCSMAVCSCGKHTQYVYTKRCTQHILSRACRDMMSEMGTQGQQITNMRCEISHSFKSGCPGVSTETSESELSKQNVSQKSSSYLNETCKLTENTSISHQSCEEACKPEAKKPRPHYCGIGIAPKTSRQSSRVACEPSPESLDNTKTARSSRSECCQEDRKKSKAHNCGVGIVQKKTSYRSCRDTSETINKECDNNCNTVVCQQEPEKPTPHYCGIGKMPKNWYHACGEASATISEGQSFQCDTKFKTNLNQRDSLQLTPHCYKIGASAKMSDQSFGQAEPLTVAIQGINMAQIQDSNCAWRLNDLMEAEDRICKYMHRLEAKELLGIAQLQQADEMWASMEEVYLNKLRELEEKQQIMLCQEKELRENLAKWRKKEKNQLKNALKVEAKAYKIEEAREKKKQLEKLINECDCLRQRIETTKKDLDQVHTNINKNIKKKQDKIEADISALEKKIALEKLKRQMKEQQGRGTVRGARDHFAAACRVLLQTELDRESLYAEEEALNLELDLMNEAMMSCKEKCQLKLKPLRDEIIAVEEDIARNNLKCVRCNACVSTTDIKKRCTDCPRCLKGTCQYKDKTCSSDDCGCVCRDVKEKFVENILDNMHNVLEADMKRNKSHLALDALKCMKQSKSGKLDAATREKIHVYVMKTVGEHLDAISTEAGVKTRSEIDPKQLAQLRLCLKEVIVGPLQEKGVRRKKSVATTSAEHSKDTQRTILNMSQMTPCMRRDGGGSALCNCPGGLDSCVCLNRVPAPGVSVSIASRSSVQNKTSTPKAHSCSSDSRKITAEASKASRVSIVTPPKVRSSTVHGRRSSSVSEPSARNNASTSDASVVRTVLSSTRSACACTASAKGPCRCIRSTKSRSSMNSKSSCSNVEYTAKVRDKLIKEVTNVAQPRSSTQMASYSHYSGSCTCIEEKELKLHRPSSRASRISGPPGLKSTSQQSQKKSSTTVCNPPSNPTGAGFMRRFSAASSRQESDKEVRKQIADNLEKLSKSEATRGGGPSSCLDWICCKKKGKTFGSVNEISSGKGIEGAGGVGGGIEGAVALKGTGVTGLASGARYTAGAAGGAGMGVGANRGAGMGADANRGAGMGADANRGAGVGADANRGAGMGADANRGAGVGADTDGAGGAGTNGNAGVNTKGSASSDTGANGSVGATGNKGVSSDGSSSADAGASRSAGANVNASVSTGESASADAGVNESAGPCRGGGASADADRSAAGVRRAGADEVGGAAVTESATRRQSQVAGTAGRTASAGADAAREIDGGKAAGGGKGAGATRGSGSGAAGRPGGADGGSGTLGGTGGTRTEGPGSFWNKLEQNTDSKQPAAIGKVNLLSSSGLPNAQGRANQIGTGASDLSNGNENFNTSDLGDSYSGTDSSIRKRTREKVKPSSELSMLYCDPEDCSEPCGQSRRESVQAKTPQTKIIKSTLKKEFSANMDSKDNLADDPCYRSYRRRFKKSFNHQTDRICKQKRRNCFCGQKNLTTVVNPTDGIRRHSYKKTIIEPQLPEFLKRHQLPRSSLNQKCIIE